MTAPATTRRAGPFNGNGVTTSFPFTFKVFATSDIAVIKTSTAGVNSTLVLSSDYSVTLNADQDATPGGSITYPISGVELAVGEKLTAIGSLPYDQTADLPTGGNYRAVVIENALDRTVMQVQQVAEGLGRALVFSPSDTEVSELPTAAARAGRLLAFDSTTGDAKASTFTETQLASAVAAAYGAGSTADAVTFLPAGTGAEARSTQAKLRDMVSILDFIPVDEHADIAAGTSTYDCYAAIMAAVNSVTYLGTFLGGPYVAGPTIYFPPGVYLCNSTVHLKKRVTLWADGSGQAYGDAAIIKWPASTTGIVIHSRYTDATNSGTFTTGADASVIEGLALVSAGGAGTTFHGIWLRGRATIERCYLENFPGDGVHIVGQAAYGWSNAATYAIDDVVESGGIAYKSLQNGNLNKTPISNPAWWVQGTTDLSGNCNNWRLEGGRINDCTGHGIFVQGADANAGMAYGVDSSSNGGWGVYDTSFLGNTYTACHTAANTTGAYKSDNANARNIFLGCYSEGGQPASEVMQPAQIIGGLHSAGSPTFDGFTAGSSAFWLDSGDTGARLKNAPLDPWKGIDFANSARSALATMLDAYTESITHTPTSSGITTTGVITYGWQGTRVGNRVDFRITVGVTAGTNAFTAGVSYVTLPAALLPTAGGACVATTSGVAQVGICYFDTSGHVNLPTWIASAATVIISGTFFVSSTAA